MRNFLFIHFLLITTMIMRMVVVVVMVMVVVVVVLVVVLINTAIIVTRTTSLLRGSRMIFTLHTLMNGFFISGFSVCMCVYLLWWFNRRLAFLMMNRKCFYTHTHTHLD